MNMNWDYIAGFFDGEGSLSTTKERHGKLEKSFRLSIAQKDLAPLLAIQKFWADKGIVSYLQTRKGKNVCSQLRVGKQLDVQTIARELYPRCIFKVPKLKEALDIIPYLPKLYPIHRDTELAKMCLQLWERGKTISEVSKELKRTDDQVTYFLYVKQNVPRVRRKK